MCPNVVDRTPAALLPLLHQATCNSMTDALRKRKLCNVCLRKGGSCVHLAHSNVLFEGDVQHTQEAERERTNMNRHNIIAPLPAVLLPELPLPLAPEYRLMLIPMGFVHDDLLNDMNAVAGQHVWQHPAMNGQNVEGLLGMLGNGALDADLRAIADQYWQDDLDYFQLNGVEPTLSSYTHVSINESIDVDEDVNSFVQGGD